MADFVIFTFTPTSRPLEGLSRDRLLQRVKTLHGGDRDF